MIKHIGDTILWNLLIITCGSTLFTVGAQCIVAQNNFITGGIFGTALLLSYKVGLLSPGIWFLLLNLPLFAFGWFHVGRRFFFYSVYGVLVVTVISQLVHLDFGIQEQIYAAIAGGIVCGAGNGLVLRSLGSTGGLDIIAIILHKRYNLGIGKTYIFYNALLFLATATIYSPDIVIASIILVFISSESLEYILRLFNQRKIVYVISDQSQEIARLMQNDLSQGATFLRGQGAYSGRDKLILMTVTNNLMLKKIENLVFQHDSEALFIVENSFNVLGSTFGRGKGY